MSEPAFHLLATKLYRPPPGDGLIVLLWLLPVTGSDVNPLNLTFFLLLITLIVTLYDRFRPVYTARLEHAAA